MKVKYGSKTLYAFTFSFANDEIIVVQDYDDRECITRKLIEEYMNWELDINLSKPEYLCVGG